MPQKIKSTKSYPVAVSISAVFGVLGIHHFYLGRHIEGVFDLTLSILAAYFYINGDIGIAVIAFALDSIHTFIITIMLLTGSFKDGKGHYVCYPGQVL
jgi:TM2 domain-containing membrane protein YozV